MAKGPGGWSGHHHGGGNWGGHWGGHRFHGGGWGPSIGFSFGGPYYAAPYYDEDCGWVRVQYWRHGRLHIRRVWRCW